MRFVYEAGYRRRRVGDEWNAGRLVHRVIDMPRFRGKNENHGIDSRQLQGLDIVEEPAPGHLSSELGKTAADRVEVILDDGAPRNEHDLRTTMTTRLSHPMSPVSVATARR